MKKRKVQGLNVGIETELKINITKGEQKNEHRNNKRGGI